MRDIPERLWAIQQWGNRIPVTHKQRTSVARVSLPPEYSRAWAVRLSPLTVLDPGGSGQNVANTEGFRALIRYGSHIGNEREIDWPACGGAFIVHGSDVEVIARNDGVGALSPTDLAAEIFPVDDGTIAGPLMQPVWTSGPVILGAAMGAVTAVQNVPNGAQQLRLFAQRYGLVESVPTGTIHVFGIGAGQEHMISANYFVDYYAAWQGYAINGMFFGDFHTRVYAARVNAELVADTIRFQYKIGF